MRKVSLSDSGFNSLLDVGCEMWALRSVSTAGWRKTNTLTRDNWVTEGRLSSTPLMNIGLLSCLHHRRTFYTIIEVWEYKYWKSLKGFTISVNTISLEGLYIRPIIKSATATIELNSCGNGVKVEVQSVSLRKKYCKSELLWLFLILPVREESLVSSKGFDWSEWSFI